MSAFKEDNPRFIFLNEIFEKRTPVAESGDRTRDALPKKPELTPEEQAKREARETAEATARKAQKEDFDRRSAEEFAQFEADMAGKEAQTNSPKETELPKEPILESSAQERYELRQESLKESFVGDHLIGNLPKVASGRLWERNPEDHWALQTVKSAVNFPTAVIANGLVIAEDVVKFGGEVAKGGYNLVTEPKETWGKVKNFFRPGMGERLGNFWKETKEDIATTWENTPWEGLLGKGTAFVADTVLGAKGLSKLGKLRNSPTKTTVAVETMAEKIGEAGSVESVAVATGIVETVGTEIGVMQPADAIRRLNSLNQEMLATNPELAQKAYALRQQVLRDSRVKGDEYMSQQTYTKEGTPAEKPKWSYVEKTENWTSERIAVQATEKKKAYEAAVPLSERMPPKTLVVLRGNSGVGKTTTLRKAELPIIRRLNILDEQGNPSGVLNPDNIKGGLRDADKVGGSHTISHYQVLQEGAKITQEVTDQLMVEGRSMVLDKRFLTPEEVLRAVEPAKKSGYRVIMIDVHAEADTSISRVAGRTFAGDDPIVPENVVRDGAEDAVLHRNTIKNLPQIDEYYFTQTD